MTTNTDIVNRALQSFGTRTTVTDAELTDESSNEAIQANLILTKLRDQLLRMAPWDCGLAYMNLVYITSVPGTPENQSAATANWQPGQPAPPWAYEYQYPNDCLRACFLIPAQQTINSVGVPITTAVTGGAASFWQGQPVKFKVATDRFRPATAAAIVSGGTGYRVGDLITLEGGAATDTPLGAPAVLRVTTIAATVITGIEIVSQVPNANPPVGGSYFRRQTGTIAQASTNGDGTGATFSLTFPATPFVDQRVILTNMQNPTLAFVRQITDPNVMDDLFLEAWAQVLGAGLCIALTGDKALANMCISRANEAIKLARQADANEGLTINDFTPDWIRTRGINWAESFTSPWSGFDWGPFWPAY